MARRLKSSLRGGRGRLASGIVGNRQMHRHVGALHHERPPGSGPGPETEPGLPACCRGQRTEGD